MDVKWNRQRSSKKKGFSVSGDEYLSRKDSRKTTESNSDASNVSINNGKARTHSVSDDATNSRVSNKIKNEAASNDGISRKGSSKKSSRKSSTNDELPSDMMVMSQRRQQRIQISTNQANKQENEDDDVFIKKDKNMKTENTGRSYLNN